MIENEIQVSGRETTVFRVYKCSERNVATAASAVSHKSGGQRVRGMRVLVHARVTRDAFRVEYRRVSSKY